MARRKRKNSEGDEMLPVVCALEDDFVPMMTAALPEWAKNITTEIITQSNSKGSPGFEPGPDQARQVEQMSALGMSPGDIAGVLRIESKLLEHYYKYELDTSSARVNNKVAKVALAMALSGSEPDMTKFWLKTRAGWTETKKVELTGNNGGPIAFSEVKRRMIEQVEAEVFDVSFEEVNE